MPTEEVNTRGLASVFDTLIASNLSLTMAVGRLVRLSWAIILFNVVLIASVIATLVWIATRGHS